MPGIDVQGLRPEFQAFLNRPDMREVRRFIEGYRLGDGFDGALDPDDPIVQIEERIRGNPPMVEIFFNVTLSDGTRQYPRCTISRRGLFPTVGIIMLLPDGRMALLDEFRVQSGLTYISVPSGCREEGESAVAAALREGRREGGCRTTLDTKVYELPPYAYHGAMLSMLERVFVVTDVASDSEQALGPADTDEWITNRRFVTPFEWAQLVRAPPDGVYLHGPALACVATAQAHGFFLSSAEDLIAFARVRESLLPLTSG